MDVSVLAAVGSFVVSERVLKPKATVLAVLGCVLVYDLTTKTRDVSSLRVYRGPALLAFTFLMVAFSLRTWRRNGVACDELLFLPGSRHGERHAAGSASDEGSTSTAERGEMTSSGARRHRSHSLVSQQQQHSPGTPSSVQPQHVSLSAIEAQRKQRPASEGDVAAGGVIRAPPVTAPAALAAYHKQQQRRRRHRRKNSPRQRSQSSDSSSADDDGVELATLPAHLKQSSSGDTGDTNGDDNKIESFPDSWTDEDDDDDETKSLTQGLVVGGVAGSSQQEVTGLLPRTNSTTMVSNKKKKSKPGGGASSPSPPPAGRRSKRRQQRDNTGTAADDGETMTDHSVHSNGEQLQLITHEEEVVDSPHHGPRYRITRIGTYFFFRSATSTTHSATYAPSGPSVVGAALDMTIPVLFNFHLFIEAYNHIEQYGTDFPAKILPLIFLSVLICRAVFPPSRRGRFYSTAVYTVMAPFHRSRFRDSFLGDIFTSVVRPCQDVFFALSYYVTVIAGTVTSRYGLSESGKILESSWILHNVVLPSCALLPLWWKFLQTLRESYDTGKRWPYLGNSFKYLTAAVVILYGMTHDEHRRSPWWIVCFGLCLLYQIWWDMVMDWELFVLGPPPGAQQGGATGGCENCRCSLCSWFVGSPSSVRPNNYILLALQMNVIQPLRDMFRLVVTRLKIIPCRIRRIQLRPRRLYKDEAFYWRIVLYNCIFRFTWMLCFIPAYHLSASGEEHVTTFSSDTKSYVGVLLPMAEIFRRTLWGFLLLEKETIKLMDGDPSYARLALQADDDVDDSEMGDDSESYLDDAGSNSQRSMTSKEDATSRHFPSYLLPVCFGTSQQQQQMQVGDAATTASSSNSWFKRACDLSDNTRHRLFIAELSLWAGAFIGFGMWATC